MEGKIKMEIICCEIIEANREKEDQDKDYINNLIHFKKCKILE